VHFPGIDSVAIEDLIFANRILANEKVLDGAPAGRSPTAVKPTTRVS
jgi:hypothetical protein